MIPPLFSHRPLAGVYNNREAIVEMSPELLLQLHLHLDPFGANRAHLNQFNQLNQLNQLFQLGRLDQLIQLVNSLN